MMRALSLILLSCLLASCGVKRNLELPKDEPKKERPSPDVI